MSDDMNEVLNEIKNLRVPVYEDKTVTKLIANMRSTVKHKDIVKCREYFDELMQIKSKIKDENLKARLVRLYTLFTHHHTNLQLWTSIHRITTLLHYIILS